MHWLLCKALFLEHSDNGYGNCIDREEDPIPVPLIFDKTKPVCHACHAPAPKGLKINVSKDICLIGALSLNTHPIISIGPFSSKTFIYFFV